MDKTTRILVVDDEPALLRLYSEVLRAEGYEVYEAATAREAFDVACQRRPHLVLLDVVLPDRSGIELCRQLKAEPALPELFIALISGAAVDSAQRVAGLAAGAEDFISKLTPPSELVARIRMLARLRDTAAALRESVEQYRQLAENIREVFWMTDLTKKQMLYVSPAYEEIWGRTCISLYVSPRDWVEAIHPEDRERVLRAALTQQAAGGYNEEYRILRPDGTLRWVQDRAFPVRDESGAVYRIVGIAEDITRRKRTEEALQKAEAKYRGIFENATEGIFQASPEGRLLVANPALARMFRYDSPEEKVGSVRPITAQLDLPPAQQAKLRRVLQEHGTVQAFEVESRRKDGTRLWVSLNARAVRNAAGTLQHYEGTVRDITERKQAEQRLTEALGFNETILAASTVGIRAFRSSGECIFANAAAGRILGATPEQLMAQDFRHLRSWKDSGLLAMAERALRSQRPATGEVRKRTEFGKELWLDCQMMAFDNLRERHLLLLQLDITPRKRLEQELHHLPQRILQAQELERQRVARELHDSVNQLLASAQMRLRRVETAVRPLRPSLAEILARSGDLLVQALEENRRIAHALRPTELDELGFTIACRDFCKQFALRTGLGTRCEITRLGRRLSPAMELNFFRIVQEAFQNAEKHARARTVRLRLVRQGSRLVLTIRDDGRGFDSGLGKSRRRSRGGMGLTNIRERAALMGGTCDIESAPGEGTAVRVRVPLQKI